MGILFYDIGEKMNIIEMYKLSRVRKATDIVKGLRERGYNVATQEETPFKYSGVVVRSGGSVPVEIHYNYCPQKARLYEGNICITFPQYGDSIRYKNLLNILNDVEREVKRKESQIIRDNNRKKLKELLCDTQN